MFSVVRMFVFGCSCVRFVLFSVVVRLWYGVSMSLWVVMICGVWLGGV